MTRFPLFSYDRKEKPKWHQFLGGTLAILFVSALVLILALLPGCSTAAPTPMFGPFEQIKLTELKRIDVPNSPDDSTPVTITLGEMKQAVSDSDQLDETLSLANTEQKDLHRVIESNNTLYDLYSEQKTIIEVGTVSGIVAIILAFMLGCSLSR